jgi:hypothetical protein
VAHAASCQQNSCSEQHHHEAPQSFYRDSMRGTNRISCIARGIAFVAAAFRPAVVAGILAGAACCARHKCLAIPMPLPDPFPESRDLAFRSAGVSPAGLVDRCPCASGRSPLRPNECAMFVRRRRKRAQAPALRMTVALQHLECGGLPPLSDGARRRRVNLNATYRGRFTSASGCENI